MIKSAIYNYLITISGFCLGIMKDQSLVDKLVTLFTYQTITLTPEMNGCFYRLHLDRNEFIRSNFKVEQPMNYKVIGVMTLYQEEYYKFRHGSYIFAIAKHFFEPPKTDQIPKSLSNPIPPLLIITPEMKGEVYRLDLATNEYKLSKFFREVPTEYKNLGLVKINGIDCYKFRHDPYFFAIPTSWF